MKGRVRMADKEWYKINEFADKLNIPHQTLRRYITNHKHLIHFKKHHKAYNIHQENEDIIRRIREMYGEGLTTEEINDALTTSPEIIVTMDSETEGEREKLELNEVLNDMRKQIHKQNDHIEKLTETLRKQGENHEKIQKYMYEKLEAREDMLRNALNSSHETQTQIASTKEKEEEEPPNFYERMKRVFINKG